MKKKDQILTLIEADITITKLIITLHDIGVCADRFNTDIMPVVFVQMGFKQSQRTEELYRDYIDLVNQVHYLDISVKGERRRLAAKIYGFLQAKI